jgi:uncharacterized membrane protein YccC
MAGMSAGAPREQGRISGATLSLVAVAVSELRRDLRDLLESGWNEAVRRRAEELSSTLAQACRHPGLRDLQPYLRAAANLTRISRDMAMPVLPALREKFRSLGNELEARLPRRSGRSPG